MLHAALLACIADEVKFELPHACTRPSQHTGQETCVHTQVDHANRDQLPLQRALVRQAAVFLPTLSALAVSAVHKMLQVVECEDAAGSMCKVRPPGSTDNRQA